MKYYAVKAGKKTGIFLTWPECQAAISGFSNPVYKSFLTKAEAVFYLNGKDYWQTVAEKDLKGGYLVAFTDGSFLKNGTKFGYGVHLILPGGLKKNISGSSDNKYFLATNNVAGEVFAVITALEFAKSNNFTKIKIYHDYIGIAKWVSSEWKTGSNIARYFVNFYNSVKKDFTEIEFIKISSHSNISYNDIADQLAKSALK